jgi:hypothetical protein
MFGRLGAMRPIRKLQRTLRDAAALTTTDLSRIGQQIRVLRDDIDQMAAQVQTEMLSRIDGDDGIVRPDQCDWAGRAGPWQSAVRPRGHANVTSPTDIGGGVTLFHDAAKAEMSLRQDRAPSHVAGAQFGIVLEVYAFDGSFVSLVQDLPEAAIKGLTRTHFLSVHLTVEHEQPLEIYARLNVQHGPNVEQMVRQVDLQGELGLAEFDLAYTKINEKRVEKAWLDLILENPEMNRVALWDMVILRAPRADL